MQKGGHFRERIFHFSENISFLMKKENISFLREYFISHEKSGHVLQKEGV